MKKDDTGVCYFTTNVADELDCDPEGNFDIYGFPVERCGLYPCKKYLDTIEKLKIRSK